MSLVRSALAAALLLLGAAARAEFPLRAESALADDPGEAEVALWTERDRQRPGRSSFVQAGAWIAQGVELELSFARRRESDDDGTVRREHVREWQLTWIPIRRAHAWSMGIAAGRSVEGRARGTEIALLASRPFDEGRKELHLNLAREREREDDSKSRRTMLIAAYQHAVTNALWLLAEIEAADREKPLRHAGIRFKIGRDLHLGATAGRNGFGSVTRLGLRVEFD